MLNICEKACDVFRSGGYALAGGLTESRLHTSEIRDLVDSGKSSGQNAAFTIARSVLK